MELKTLAAYLFERLKDVRPVTTKVGSQEYAVRVDGTLGEPIRPVAPLEKPVFAVSTLSALATLYRANVDDFEKTVAIHVADYRTVNLVSLKADEFGRRHIYACAKHTADTPFRFDHYYPSPEDFLIPFRASFYFNDEAVNVQRLCSTIGSGEGVAVQDDGLSQEVVVKTGTVTKASVSLPTDGVGLIPWRTFREVDPVQSRFLLRMKGVKDSLPHIALFEIDQRWRLDTVNSIKDWLVTEIPGAVVIS